MRTIMFEDILSMNISTEQCVEWSKYVILHKNEFVLHPKDSIKFGNNCFFNTMPSLLPTLDVFGVKEVSRITDRVPALRADILLYDSKNGNLLSLMDGTWITTMRTGAVAAVTINLLKKSDVKEFSFIGLGNTARATLLCYDEINGHKDLNVNILAYKNQHIDFIERFKNFKNIHFSVITDIEELVRKSDVLVSCVTAMDSTFADEKYYKKGCLVVPIHTRGFQNCDLVFDKIFCDDIGHISNFKYFKQYKSVTEMTDVFTGKSTGRTFDDERILAYNIGISVQDIYFALQIYNKFLEREKVKENKFWV